MFHDLRCTNTCCIVSTVTCTCGWEHGENSSQDQTGAEGLYDCYASALAALGRCCFIPQQILLNNHPSGLFQGLPAQAKAGQTAASARPTSALGFPLEKSRTIHKPGVISCFAIQRPETLLLPWCCLFVPVLLL